MFFTNIGQHLRSLADFRGRENREPFWLWVLAVYIVQAMVTMIAMMPVTQSLFGEVFAAAGNNPDYLNAHPEVMRQLMARAFAPMMKVMFAGGAVLALLLAVLVGAAVVRRLHDRDMPGWWALPLLVLQVATPLLYAAVMPDVMGAMLAAPTFGTPGAPDPAIERITATMAPVSILNLVGLVVLIGTVVVLAQAGTAGPNRYGEDPLARD